MQTELITLSAPEYWAPALINGDWSGLNAEQAAQARDFLVGEGIASVETCEEGGFMWRHDASRYGVLGATCADYLCRVYVA
jgi:hypothetical protein